MRLGQLIMAVSVDTVRHPDRSVAFATGRRRQSLSLAGHAKALLFICCAGLPTLPAHADVTASDMQVMGRALSFLDKPLSGEVTVGVVYAADIPQSARETEDLQRMLERGLRVGNVVLRTVPVSLDRVALANVDVLFLTAGLGDRANPVAIASRTRRLPCITTDILQVQSGRCAVGVSSQPKIEILVNRAAALANGTAFSTLFRMMIDEI